MFLSSGWWINVGRPIGRSKNCESIRKNEEEEAPKASITLKLTIHLHDDWLRLYHRGADGQSAAIISCIHSLHRVNTAIQYSTVQCMRIHPSGYSACHTYLHMFFTYLTAERRVVTPSVSVWRSLIKTWPFGARSSPFFTQVMVGSTLASGMSIEQLNLASWPSDSWMEPMVGLKCSSLSWSWLR